MGNNIRKEDNIHIITLEGNFLTEQQGQALLSEIDQIIENGSNLFVVDLAGLKFINSSGLSFLLRILTKARRANGDTVLTNMPEQLPKLLVITKLNAVFNTTENIDEAINILSKK